MLSPFIQPFSKIWWKGVWQLHWEGQKCQIIAFLPEQRAPIIEYSACKDLSHFSWQPSLFFRSPPTLCSCLYRKWEGSVCRALRTNSVCMGVCRVMEMLAAGEKQMREEKKSASVQVHRARTTLSPLRHVSIIINHSNPLDGTHTHTHKHPFHYRR